jgi:hypothetical protein
MNWDCFIGPKLGKTELRNNQIGCPHQTTVVYNHLQKSHCGK